MKNHNIDGLVSVILEEIKKTHLNEQTSSNQFVFVGDRNDLMNYLRVTEPSQGTHETEFNEMAREREYPVEKTPQPLRIPVELLKKSARTPNIPPIKSRDPETNELVEDVVISDLVMTTPSGRRFVIFENFAGREEGGGKKIEYYVEIPENMFMMAKPRGQAYGKPISKDVRSDLKKDIPGESEEDREKRLQKARNIEEGEAKRILFPIINYMFTNQDVLDQLDKCLIPETWAGPKTTEHTTNVKIRKSFGGKTTEIDADFYAVKDFTDINETIDKMMDLRAELALLEVGAERPFEREKSQSVPRRHANYIYKRGNWEARYRTHDENIFEDEGAKTMIYRLNSKNIQEGKKSISNESVLHIKGYVEGESYILTARFSTTVNARDRNSGKGMNKGNLYNPITVSISKPLPDDIPTEELNLVDHPEFWVNEGRKRGKRGETFLRTGFLPDLINKLGDEIVTNIDVDEIQQRLVQLAEEYVAATEEENI